MSTTSEHEIVSSNDLSTIIGAHCANELSNTPPFFSLAAVIGLTFFLLTTRALSLAFFELTAATSLCILGGTTYLIVRNSRQFVNFGFLHFAGGALLGISLIDFFRLATFLIPSWSNVPASLLRDQLWIIARALQVLSLLGSLLYLRKEVATRLWGFIFIAICLIFVAAAALGFMPEKFIISPEGLVSSFVLYTALCIGLSYFSFTIYKQRSTFTKRSHQQMQTAFALILVAILSFAFRSFSPQIATIVKGTALFFVFYFLFRAVIEQCLHYPQDVIFNEMNYRKLALDEEIRETRKEVNQSNANYQNLFDGLADPAFIHLPDGTILMANRAATSVLGFSEKAIISMNIKEIILRDSNIQTDEFNNHSISSEGNLTEVVFQTQTRKSIPFETHSRMMTFFGQRVLFTTARNISERKANFEAVVSAKNTLEQLDRSKTAFLASLSAELRTPLSNITGYADLILCKSDHALFAQEAHAIQSAASQLIENLDNLLTLAKIESDTLTNCPRKFPIQDFIDRVTHRYSEFAQKQKVTFVVEHEASLPTSVLGDFEKIEQLTSNLLSNAIKVSENGIVKLILMSRNQNGFIIAVQDTGNGLAPEKQKFLTDKFDSKLYFVEKSEKDAPLGLSIVRSLTDLMKGRIEVKAEKGKGTIVTVTLDEVKTE